jgi:large subunit ribosomal protein L23
VEEKMTTLYKILRRPIITEKTSYQNEDLHQFVFEVASEATKAMVKEAVERIFEVEVLRVNIINIPAKKKKSLRNRRMVSRRKAYKKAVVTLAPGDSIPVFEGVK